MTYTSTTIPPEISNGTYLIGSYQQFRFASTFNGTFHVNSTGQLIFRENNQHEYQ